MSQNLLTQLAEYGEFCEDRQWSVTADEVFDELVVHVVPQMASVEPTRHNRGWLVAGITATVVLVLGLLTFLTRQTVPEAPVASQPSPSPTVAAPGPVPSTPIEGTVSDWSRIPHDEKVFGGAEMVSITAGGPGLVVVGGDTVWTSVDGVTWSRVPYDEAVFGGAEMVSITVGGPGLVVVGGDTVWTSVDGVTWFRVPYDETVFGGASIKGVTVGGPGLVAVGEVNSDAAVWTSVDGVTWSRISHDEAVFGGADDQMMNSVTAGGPGLVAVGRGDHGAVVWTSVFGILWSRVPHDETVFGDGDDGIGSPEMLDVTAGGPGLVAVGVNRGEVPVWTSSDGITWNPVPTDWRVFDGGNITSVTVGGPGLVAVGERGLYESADGITWTRTHHPGSAYDSLGRRGSISIEAVAVAGPGLVAVGSDWLGDRNAAVWVRGD
jgi:hypothetical protein